MVTLLMVLMSSGFTPGAAPDDDRPRLRVRAHADSRVDWTMLERARKVATGLLDSAGVATVWQVCHEACQPEDGPGAEVVVILSSHPRLSGGDHCGRASRGSRTAEGTVMVSVPCVAGVAFRLARRQATRSHPLLATDSHEDLVGAVVAHEIAHLLGVPHAATGLMRARLEADDIIALRLGRLGFSSHEAALMRSRAGSTLALPSAPVRRERFAVSNRRPELVPR